MTGRRSAAGGFYMKWEWEWKEQLEREEALLRELDEKTPPMSDEFVHTLEGLSQLTGFIDEDVGHALHADRSEVHQRLKEIARKANTIGNWLRKKADECKGES